MNANADPKIQTENLRRQIRDMAEDWAINPRTNYQIQQRVSKLKVLLYAYQVRELAHIQEGDLQSFRRDLDNLINGVEEGQAVS